MKTVTIFAVLAQALMMPATALADASAPLAPTGKWIIGYNDADCLLTHDFGTEKPFTSVGLKPSPFGDHVEVVALTKGSGKSNRAAKVKLVLEPSGLTVEKESSVFAVPDKGLMLTTIYADADVATELLNSTGVTISAAGAPSITVRLPNMKAAIGALRTCQNDLMKGWGIDPTEIDRIVEPPKGGSPADWLTSDDYPADALADHKQGTSTIVWVVGLDGRVANCKVVKSAGTPSLDEAACRAISRRAHYKPAIGKDGKPIVAHQMRDIRWQLPD